jgi:hypothetical protein
MGDTRGAVWWGIPRERGHLEDLGVERRIILKCIFKNWMRRHGLN